MEKLTLTKIDFKKYLLDKVHDCRQEELIFWKNEIPLPLDLVYKIFDIRGDLIKSYVDHLVSICFYFDYLKKTGNDLHKFEKLPSPGVVSKLEGAQIFNKYFHQSEVDKVAETIAAKLMLSIYHFDSSNFISALSHEGRKYKRLYIPAELKKIISSFEPKILEYIGISNGDMFGNVVADQLKVYRSGFSDAFSVIFNKLIDFILEGNSEKIISYSTASRIRISQSSDVNAELRFLFGSVQDGSLWEPKYLNSETGFVVNINHPYFEFVKDKKGEEVLMDIIAIASKIEDETTKDSVSKVLSLFRQELSRRLRLKSEM